MSLSGHYLNEQSVFLIYQTFQDQLGYEVVTPFQLADIDQIVLVSRGWSGITSYAELAAALPRIEGPVTLQGQIFVPTLAQASQTNTRWDLPWPLLIRYLNIAEIAPLFNVPVFPYVVRLAPQQPGVLLRHWPVVLVDSGRNFSYALQWFSMALALILVSLLLSTNLLKLMAARGQAD